MLSQYEDPYGLTFTASRPESAASFAQLTSAYMGFRDNTGELLKALGASDPDMPMAICTKGYFAKLFAAAGPSARATATSRELNERIRQFGATEREKLHAAALTAWCAGQLEKTTDLWEQILLDNPNDGMALRLAHFTHFYSGDERKMRDSVARVLPSWSPEHPDYGFLEGMYAFGLEEAGEYDRAERYGRRAVERNPTDAWSIHAVAHVLEMTERHDEGIRWVTHFEKGLGSVNNFRLHLSWHKCLFHLERGEFDEVLRLYDEQVASDIASDFYLDMCNASSLLWRLEMFGIDVGNRWHDLAAVAKNHVGDTDLVFAALHYLMVLLAAGDAGSVNRMMANLREWSALDDTQGRVCADVGWALAEGLQLARGGEYARALMKMEPVRYRLDQIGGSRAQRDLFHMILLDAAKASKATQKARALFAERLSSKAHSSWSWSNYAAILGELGLHGAAKSATLRADQVRSAGSA